MPWVDIVTDDILVYGNNIQEHNIRLDALLKRAIEVDLKLNPSKYVVTYVGHLLTPEGLKPNPERLQAIIDMEVPSDKHAI